MCKTWERIRMLISLVFKPNEIRISIRMKIRIRIGIRMEIRIRIGIKMEIRIRIGITTMPIHNTVKYKDLIALPLLFSLF
jgi:hypothetical protein